MTYDIRNMRWNEDGVTIDMEVCVGGVWYPFTADPNDQEEHGRVLFDAARRADVLPYIPPPPAPDPVPIIDAVDLWQRATDEEAEAIEGYMAQAPARVRNIFRVANTFRGDHELFGMLKDAAETLFSPERAAALLAPSRYE